MSWQYIEVERNNRIVTVRFDSGEDKNPITRELMIELTEVARELAEDVDISAVVLAGPADIFTSGAHLKSLLSVSPESVGMSEFRKLSQYGPKMCEAWERIEAMTIVAIEGWCIGAGYALAVACDLRVMGNSAMLYVPEVERGITMSWGSVPRTVNLIGPAKAKRAISLAEKMSAERALDWGLADEVVEDGQAYDKAMAFAQRAAELPPLPLRLSKQAINHSANALNHATSFMDNEQVMLMQFTEDFEEAKAAFFEKRAPKYSGR